MKTKRKKALSLVLSVLMLLSLLPETVFATEANSNSLTVASKKTAQLAPGVTETTVVSYDKNGDRVKYWAVKAEVSKIDTIEIKANYHDNDNTGVWGKATVVEQANAATAKRGYNVVVSQNAAYYNVTTGQPTGAFVMEGVNINGDSMGNQTEFFAQMDDGTYMIGKRGTFSQYSEHVVEAIGGYKLLVWDGAVVAGLNAVDKYPRSTIGVTAEGDVITMMADGNQKPTSAGLTYAEQAQLMLELGCVAAVELDGGGSATYASKYEGETEITVRNNCCDGTVRSVSNTFMIISTAVADGQFDHANLSTEYAYYVANSKVAIDASGADAAGHAAEIPADVFWTLSDSSFGSVTNGVFQSNGKLGTVTVNMISGGKAVGSIDVTIVNPSSVAFSATEKTLPYGKLADMNVSAMYNGAEVYAEASAFDFAMSNAAGTMDNFNFMATSDESVKSTVLTATYKYAANLVAKVTINFGKGSEVLFDFENYGKGEEFNWGTWYDLDAAAKAGKYDRGYISQYAPDQTSSNQVCAGIQENVALVNAENGKVHSGDYALEYTFDYRNSTEYCNWMYGYLYYWGDPITLLDTAKGINGVRLGMWKYIPEEAVGSCSRFAYTYRDNATGKINTAYLYLTYQYIQKGFSKLTSDKIPEAGWAYVSVDMNQISNSFVSTSYFYNEDGTLTRDVAGKTPDQNLAANYAPAFIQWIISSSATGAEKCTFYIDDITLDYSDAVDDRDAPSIANITYADSTMSDAAVLNNQTTTQSKIDFAATVEEDLKHNFTAIDASSAAVYVDGQKVAAKYTATTQYTGVFAASVVLSDGTHDVTFEIADKQGNYVKTTKQITVAADSNYPSVVVTGEKMNGSADIKCGEQYNINVTTNKAEAIDTLTTTIWLNSASTWALDHMIVAQGFNASYTLDEVACKATITLTNEGTTLTGKATLVTIPVYNFSYNSYMGITAQQQWNSYGTAPILTLSWDVQYGKVTYTDGNEVDVAGFVAGFGNKRIDERTELNTSIQNLKNAGKEWHYHTPVAVSDKAATCTETGYTGRTVCSDCNSIIDWGTTVPATGHAYEVVDGVLKCHCGELFSGEFEGRTYVDGIAQNGWVGDFYYKVGVKLTGIQNIEGYYYDFGTDGVCAEQAKYNGLFEQNGKNYYAVMGELKSGWMTVDDEWYYFDKNTSAGVDGTISSSVTGTGMPFTYSFDNGKLSSGRWIYVDHGIRYYYGPSFYYKEWKTVDAKTYYFDNYGCIVTGTAVIKNDPWSASKCYVFDNNGVFLHKSNMTGAISYNGNLYYLIDGVVSTYGLIKDGDDYYYVRGNETLVTGSYYCTKTNDLLPIGTYEFGADGKMLQGVVEKSGTVYYYADGKLAYAGLIETDGNYYYIKGNCTAATGSYNVVKTNGLLPAGIYEFSADGKMLQGLVEKNGVTYYYENGKLANAGLIQADDSYYYISNGVAVTGNKYCAKVNGLLPVGTYKFGADGKMLTMYLEEKNGKLYYYEYGKLTYGGLVELDGDYYYVKGSGQAAIGEYYCVKTNGLLPAGTYTFGTDGKMLTKAQSIEEKDGKLYYYEYGKLTYAGLVEVDGDYYYIKGSGQAVTGEYYCAKTNGLAVVGCYTFGADGKMTSVVNGFEEKNGKMYYYEKGKLTYGGLVEVDGAYYYVKGSGTAATGTCYVSKTNGLVPAGYYTFGADGKMTSVVNGFEEKNGKLYYYENGKLTYGGLVEVNGAYYYVKGSGTAATGTCYVSKTNGLLLEGRYIFGTDGKMILD